jgi:hypothetical protein
LSSNPSTRERKRKRPCLEKEDEEGPIGTLEKETSVQGKPLRFT